MKKNKILAGLVAMLPFVTSCDNHTFEDYSWHSWAPGMVYCTNGDVVTYEKCMADGNVPEAVLFYVDKNDETSGIAYAVSLKEYEGKAFSDPDTTYFVQGTSANIVQYDGETNTTSLRYNQIASPLAKSVNPKYYVPSVAEMYRLYVARDVVNTTISKCNGDVLPINNESCWYWTSTECEAAQTDRAWRYSLYSGRFESADKHFEYPFRPIMLIRLNNAEK